MSLLNELQTRLGGWGFVWAWLLGFGLVVYLGLSGGGYDSVVSGEAGIAIWWILLLGVLVGALPRRRPGGAALVSLGLLAAFAAWTTLSLRWTESSEKTATEAAMVITLLGVFGLAILSRGRKGAGQMVGAVAAGIAVIALVALLARLHPSFFPAAAEAGRFLESSRERLSYPLDYWNALGALIGIGLPLILHFSSSSRSTAVKALAGAAMPAMILALFLTLSRGGIAGAVLALAIYMLLADDRLPKALSLAIGGAGGGVLIFLISRRDEIEHGFTGPLARSQGNEMLWIAVVVCLLAGAAHAALAYGRRPRWAHVSRDQTLVACGAALLIVIVAFLAAGGPHRVSHAWTEFKKPSGETNRGTSRLGSAGGENRYQLWSSAVREFDSKPLTGTGSNTFQLWWTRDSDVSAAILDTHSLYLQTLGELGIVGLALLAVFIALATYCGVIRAVRSGPGGRRSVLAAAVAGSTVLWTTSLNDWDWKIPVVPVAALLLLAVAITAGDPEEESDPALSLPLRGAVVVVSLLALVAIAIPLAGTTLLRQSQDEAREGDTSAALEDARSAQNVQPGAASPRTQEALLLEEEGQLGAAAEAALAATEREPTNWRTWLLLSRIEAQRERPGPALAYYRKARSLNPLSPIFSSS